MAKLFALLAISIAAVFVGYGQNCNITLKGRVTDENSVDALDGAVVTVVQTQQSVLTDNKGRFTIPMLCPGNISLAVTHIGCEPQLITVQLVADTNIKLKLNHREEEMEAVEITAAKTESHNTQSSFTLESMSLNKLRGSNLAETIKKVPGVYSLNTGATIAKPVIHGLHSNRVLIMNNGVRLEAQQWGSEHAPEIDPFLAQKITVIKGANSLRYGSDAIGGVILVEPNPLPTKHGLGGEVNLAMFSNNAEVNLSATLEGCFHRVPALGWRVQGTYRKAGNSRAPDYWLGNTGLQEGNFSAAIGYKKPKAGFEIFFSRFETKLGILSAAHIGNVTDLLQAIENGNPTTSSDFTYGIGRPYQNVVHYLAKAQGYFRLRDGSDATLIFSWQDNERQEYDKPHFYQQDKTRPGFYFQIQTIQAGFEWHHKQVKNVSGTLGVTAATQTNNFKYSYFIPDFWNFSGGVFAVERWVKGNFELEGGLRLDYKWAEYFIRTTSTQFDTSYNFISPSGNLGMEYHISEKLLWRMNAGSAFRAPAANELFADGVHHGAAIYERGNRYLKPEQSFNLSTSVDFDTRYLTGSVELYTNYIMNFINLVPVQPPRLTIRGTFPSFEYRRQNALLTGADVSFTLKPHKGLEFYSKSSLLFARNTIAKDWLEQMPPLRFENGVQYTLTVNKALQNISFGAEIVNVPKQVFVPSTATDYALPPKGYFLLNFSVNSNWKVNLNEFMLGLTVDNAANMKYRDYLDRFRYFADARGINAALRFRWSFFMPQHN